MRRVAQIIESVVQRCGLARGDGHPLWRFRLDQAELSALRDALREEMRPERVSDVVCGGFCLFAAHHFCRTHDGGPWSWEPITVAIGRSQPWASLYSIVRRGLAFWGRRVLRFGDSHEYLATLVCEGGLPLRAIADPANQGRVRRWFREVLRVAERFELPASHVAAQLEELLPPTLRNELVRTTGAALIEGIMTLRREAGGAADPASRLDQLRPEWRQELPLQIDDVVARELINGLLREPAPTTVTDDAPTIECTLELDIGPRIERSLLIPRSLKGEHLSRWLGMNEPPVRMAFHLTNEEGARMLAAIATKLAGEEVWRVEHGDLAAAVTSWPGAGGAVRVVTTSGPRDLVTVHPAGGDPLPEELPWVFEDRAAGRARMLKTGSVRTAANSVLVAVPPEGTLEQEAGSEVQEVGVVAGANRRLLRLKGSARWEMGDAHCVIRTSSKSDAESQTYMLVGPMSVVGFGGHEVHRGHPAVKMFERGVARTIPRSSLRWRSARRGSWQTAEHPGFGDLALRVVQEGEVCFETRLSVVPRDLEVRTKVDGSTGAFYLRSSELAGAAISMPDGTPLATGRREGEELVCEGIDVDPNKTPRIFLHLRFRGGGETKLPVASPRPFIGFVRMDGSLAPRLVSLDDLSTLRARALDPDPRASFAIEARRNGFPFVRVASLPRRGDGFFELVLDNIRETIEALHIADGIDDVVELCLAKVGIVKRDAERTLEVVARRDAFEPLKNGDGTVDLVLYEGTSEPLGLRVEARPIECFLDPPAKGPRLEVPRIEQGRWRFDPGDEPFDMWLITGFQGGFCGFRPLRVRGRNMPPPSDSALVSAIRISNAKSREVALIEVLRACAADAGHSDWSKLVPLLRAAAPLPPATFDVVRLLPRVPEAALVALARLRRDEDRSLIWRMVERLDFLWAALPMEAWIRAARALLAWYHKTPVILEAEACSAEEMVTRNMDALLRSVLPDAPHVDVVRDVLARMLPLACDSRLISLAQQPIGQTVLLTQLEDLKNDLRLRHVDDDWPTCDLEAFARTDEKLHRAFREARLTADDKAHAAVLDAPTLAAAASVTGLNLPPVARLELRRLRAFDKPWFQQSHAVQLTRLLATRIDGLLRSS